MSDRLCRLLATGLHCRALGCALVLCALLLCSCAANPRPGPDLSEAPAQDNSLVQFVSTSQPGAQGLVEDPALGQVRVLAGGKYISGLGELCRQATVTSLTSGAEDRLAVCQDADNHWRFMPRIFISAATQQPRP